MLENFGYVIVNGLNWTFEGKITSTWITRDDELRRRQSEWNAQRFSVHMADNPDRVIAVVDAGAFTHLAARAIEAS